VSKKNRKMIDKELKTVTEIIAGLCWDLKEPSEKDIAYLTDGINALQRVSIEFVSSDAPKALKDLAQKVQEGRSE